MRANIVIAVAAVGSEEDLQAFMELLRADTEYRAAKIARDIMKGRIELIPQEEVIGELPEPPGSPS